MRSESVNLPALLADIRGLLLAQAREKGLALRLHVTPRTPITILADRAALRDILLNHQYVRIGNRFHPDWELHKTALRLRVGTPLSDQEPLKVGDQDYMVASYARDVLFAPTGDWALVRRLSDML